MTKKLSGKVAIVTGGARGLGRAYAIRLAGLGARIGVIDINLGGEQEENGTVLQELEAMGAQAMGAVADISNREQVFQAIEQIAQHFGRIDVVICNAGGGSGEFFENAPSNINFEQYEQVMARNLSGTIYTVNAVVPYMKKQRSGKIITVSSHVGIESSNNHGYAHYALSKAAIRFYSLMASNELGPYGITVNCIAPGYIATERLAQQFKKRGEEYYTSFTSLRRLGTPEDCAKVVEFLSTDLSDFVTGVTLEVTGGTTGKLG